jgi:hypothetical protein
MMPPDSKCAITAPNAKISDLIEDVVRTLVRAGHTIRRTAYVSWRSGDADSDVQSSRGAGVHRRRPRGVHYTSSVWGYIEDLEKVLVRAGHSVYCNCSGSIASNHNACMSHATFACALQQRMDELRILLDLEPDLVRRRHSRSKPCRRFQRRYEC